MKPKLFLISFLALLAVLHTTVVADETNWVSNPPFERADAGDRSLSTTIQAQLEVHSYFPGGSGEVVSLDAKTQHLVLNPTNHPERGWRCWWYVRLTGIRQGETVTLDVGNAPWATPDRATFSVDGGET